MCSGDACGGVCSPGAKGCKTASVPQVCGASGQWDDQPACSQPSPDCGGGDCSCDSPHVACPSGCADLQTDAHHCGACGHDCQSGACLAGACQPVTVAKPEASPAGLALDASYVYWTTFSATGQVKRAPRAGGPAEVLVDGQPYASGVAVDGTSVYWATNAYPGAVMKAGLDGSNPTVLATQDHPLYLATDADTVYWTT